MKKGSVVATDECVEVSSILLLVVLNQTQPDAGFINPDEMS